MLVQLFGRESGDRALEPTKRGYQITYRDGEANRCPGCGKSHWYVGRHSAECGFCGTALALTSSLGAGVGLFRSRGRTLDDFATAA